MRNFLMGLWKDESGAAAAEYALLLAIVAIGIVAAVSSLSGSISGAVNEACGVITNGTTGSPCA